MYIELNRIETCLDLHYSHCDKLCKLEYSCNHLLLHHKNNVKYTTCNGNTIWHFEKHFIIQFILHLK